MITSSAERAPQLVSAMRLPGGADGRQGPHTVGCLKCHTIAAAQPSNQGCNLGCSSPLSRAVRLGSQMQPDLQCERSGTPADAARSSF